MQRRISAAIGADHGDALGGEGGVVLAEALFSTQAAQSDRGRMLKQQQSIGDLVLYPLFAQLFLLFPRKQVRDCACVGPTKIGGRMGHGVALREWGVWRARGGKIGGMDVSLLTLGMMMLNLKLAVLEVERAVGWTLALASEDVGDFAFYDFVGIVDEACEQIVGFGGVDLVEGFDCAQTDQPVFVFDFAIEMGDGGFADASESFGGDFPFVSAAQTFDNGLDGVFGTHRAEGKDRSRPLIGARQMQPRKQEGFGFFAKLRKDFSECAGFLLFELWKDRCDLVDVFEVCGAAQSSGGIHAILRILEKL